MRLRQRSPSGLAAAASLARLSTGTRLPDSATSIVREFLDLPSLPGDEISVALGDARSAVRAAMDGLPEQPTIFVKSCESPHALARFQNIGQCVRLMETWRDFPDTFAPPVAALLRDRAAPVRAAAVSALYLSLIHTPCIGRERRQPAI